MLKTYSGMDKEKRELLSNLLKRLMIELKNEAVRDNKFFKETLSKRKKSSKLIEDFFLEKKPAKENFAGFLMRAVG